MNFWLFIWVVLAVFVLGIFFWSMQILLRQKSAWKAFAKANELGYQSGKFLESPVVNGKYKGMGLTIYSEEQPVDDASRRQFRSIILLHIEESYPTGGLIGTEANKNFIEQLNLPKRYTPSAKSWDKNMVFHVQDDKKAKSFFVKDRLTALHKLLHIKDSEGLFIFDDKEGYYRYETASPLDNLDGLKKRVDALVKECNLLLPSHTPADTKKTES